MTLRDGSQRLSRPHLLVLGDQRLAAVLRDALEDVSVDFAETADETEGLNVALVVIGGWSPLLEATQVRVHPVLADVSIIVDGPARIHPTALGRLDIDLIDDGPDGSSLIALIRKRLDDAPTRLPTPSSASATPSAIA